MRRATDPSSESNDVGGPKDDVLERAKGGDRDAQGALLTEHHDFVRRMLLRLVGPTQDLDDLQQSVFVHVLSSLGSFRGASALRTWIGGICVNVARDYIRRRARNRVWLGGDADELIGATTSGEQPEARVALRQSLAALELLSPNQRMAFVMKVVMGYSVAEIAELMGSALSTTRLRLYWARRKFSRAVGAAVDDADAPAPPEETE